MTTPLTSPIVAPMAERGVFETDAAPGYRAFVLYVAGERQARVEVQAGVAGEAITFLWRLLCARDRHLRLVD
jgi:hypothetical protein